jgi:hypothetical protein
MPDITNSSKVIVTSAGRTVRVFEGPDVEKLQNDAVILQQELIASGKPDVKIQTLKGITG